MTHFTKVHAAAPIDPKRGFSIHLLVFVIAIPAIWLIWYLTSAVYIWPLWHSLAWATGLILHYLGVFIFRKSKNN